jgi:deoxyribodipyrimidine photo-lyase
MFRRLTHNHALDRALELARQLQKPLVIYEGLRLDYPWANARFHRFMLEGMQDNQRTAQRIGATYWSYVETPDQPARGLVRKLVASACCAVTDDYPQFIVPAQSRSVAQRMDVRMEAIDGNSVVPLSLLGAPVAAAAHLRPRIHKLFAAAWESRANAEPDFRDLPRAPTPPFDLWEPPADLGAFVSKLPLDHTVPAVAGAVGGATAGHEALAEFVRHKLPRYADERNAPDDPTRTAASGLSAHLHYGHLGIEQVVAATLGPDWQPSEINPKTRNKDDFFCRDANVNGYLDEAITWRDVGFQWNFRRALPGTPGTVSRGANPEWPAYNFASADFAALPTTGTLAGVLPSWAMQSLKDHTADKREYLYELEQFENADTHDELWNAAQRELVATGRIHNYLRMLWGKKVLEWSATPEQAYRVLEHLNNKYALDGRDPNSYTGILWCFGLFDRPWPPERPVFGCIRFMSSANTAKKFKLHGYYDYVRRLPKVAEVQAGETRVRPQGLFG